MAKATTPVKLNSNQFLINKKNTSKDTGVLMIENCSAILLFFD
jgi:hypothetical protein